jgi:hypothetical protein
MIIKTYEERGDEAIIRHHQPETDLDYARARVQEAKKRGLEQGHGDLVYIGEIPKIALLQHPELLQGDGESIDTYWRTEGQDFCVVKPERFLGRATKVIL